MWQSLKRMLKRARASPGMRLTVLLPTSIEVNSRFDGCELRAALVERLALQRLDQLHQAADRIVGALRIGDVALLAGDDQMAVERAAPADLDGVAELLLTLLGSPRMQWSNFSPRSAAHCSSLGVPLTAMPSSSPVIRNEIEPFGLPPLRGEMIEHRGERAGDAALHVDGAAAVQLAAVDSRRRTADASRPSRRPAAPRRYGRRTSDAARRVPMRA